MKLLRTEGKLRIDNFHPWVAFEIACRIETDGIKYYETLAAKIEEPAAHGIVLYLKTAEEAHYRFFKRLRDKFAPPPEQEMDLHRMIHYALFEGRFQYADIKTPPELIKFGIYIEDRSIELYTFYQPFMTAEDAKKSFEEIAGEEKKHKEALTGLLKQYSNA